MNKNLFFFYSCCFFKGLPPLPQLGLWTFEPTIDFFHWSAVFTHLEPAIPFFILVSGFEPTIDFFHWSAVFTHLEPAIPFFILVSGFEPTIDFFHWSAVFTHLEPAIPFFILVSGFPHRKCYDVILWSRDRSRPIRSQEIYQTSPTYY